MEQWENKQDTTVQCSHIERVQTRPEPEGSLVPCLQNRSGTSLCRLVQDGLGVAAVSSREGPVSPQSPEPEPIHWLTPCLGWRRNVCRLEQRNIFGKKLHIRRKNAPALLWSYCWKPNMSSERWEKSFSFRALRAEPSAALTLQTHRQKHLFIKKASQWPYNVCKADTCRTSVSGWVCVLCGWLGTGKSGAPVLGPLWCRRRGCFPLRSN